MLREQQKRYLDKVDDGVEILIRRGKTSSYKIVPVSDSDTGIDKKHMLRPDADLARAITARAAVGGSKGGFEKNV
ncbi:MAG: hypothetical protein LBK47_02485 [Prevotellaceae bacterium]|jgi:hypothetical protein|nr:hypothetical protein [Prevotellaceae bacterium]